MSRYAEAKPYALPTSLSDLTGSARGNSLNRPFAAEGVLVQVFRAAFSLK